MDFFSRLKTPLANLTLLVGWFIVSGCQTTMNVPSEMNTAVCHFTGWSKPAVDRLWQQFLESKEFIFSKSPDGNIRLDRKGSHWDHLKYGSFLEPEAWLRIEPSSEDVSDETLTTLTLKVSIITDRLSGMEETRQATQRHMEEVQDLLRQFESLLLSPVGESSDF
jgi:hypothetical protein